MVRVSLKRQDGAVAAVRVEGHTGSAPKGEDIICAGVSALVQTFYFSVRRLLQVDADADIRDGYFSFSVPSGLPPEKQEKVAFLAESMLIGLDEINRSYPGFLQVYDDGR